jgi:Alcohol dehydrogenase GroES-like domain
LKSLPWLGWACGICEYCCRGSENLCPPARFTGYQINGGFAREMTADARFVFKAVIRDDRFHHTAAWNGRSRDWRSLAINLPPNHFRREAFSPSHCTNRRMRRSSPEKLYTDPSHLLAYPDTASNCRSTHQASPIS